MIGRDPPTHETTPLLSIHQHSQTTTPPSRHGANKYLVLFIIAFLGLAADLNAYISAAPQTEIFETIICRNLFPDSNDLCKSEPVQSELALVIGWKDTFDLVPGLLLSLPYGALADRYGRKPVLLLGVLGYLLADVWVKIVCYYSNVLPLRLIWFSGLWKFIGGGERVVAATAFVMLSDLYSATERTNALLSMVGATILSEVVGSPISAILMQYGPWFPYAIGLGFALCGASSSLLLPETLNANKAAISEPVSDDEGTLNVSMKRSVIGKAVQKIKKFISSADFIWKSSPVTLCLFALLVSTISKQSSNLLIQYASKKFDWSIPKAGLLISIRGCVTLGSFFVLMPLLSYFVAVNMSHQRPSQWKDLVLSQGTSALSVIGYVIMAAGAVPAVLITGLSVSSLGSTSAVTFRSVATALVTPEHFGTLHAAAGISECVGGLVAGPLLAYSYSFGLHMGGAWLGLPFLVAAFVYGLALVAISCVRLPEESTDDGDSMLYMDPADSI